MAKVNMKETDYYRSGRHRENYLNASKKGTLVASERAAAKRLALQEEYALVPSKCTNCQCPLDFSKRTNKFCGKSCAAKYNMLRRDKSVRQEQAKTLKQTLLQQSPKYTKIFLCEFCNRYYEGEGRSVCFSEICLFQSRSRASKKARETAKNRGTFTGWQKRTKEPSYAEKYFISLFEKENITGYVREYCVDKWFIDFAFVERKIAIEIDGKQHEYKERKESDEIKDNYLSENQWTIFRIKWVNPINDKNKKILYPQIEKMKKLFFK